MPPLHDACPEVRAPGVVGHGGHGTRAANEQDAAPPDAWLPGETRNAPALVNCMTELDGATVPPTIRVQVCVPDADAGPTTRVPWLGVPGSEPTWR